MALEHMALDQPLVLTTDQAGAMLGVSGRTILRMIEDGQLPSIKIRGAKRVPREALVEYIRQHQTVKGAKTTPCRTAAKTRRIGGSATPMRAANELGSLLGLPTEKKQRP